MSKKIKLLIEVDEENYQLIKGMADVAGMSFCEILRNGTPITEGDLISREALAKAIEEVEDNYDGYEPNDLGKFMNKVYDLIDNAPSIGGNQNE